MKLLSLLLLVGLMSGCSPKAVEPVKPEPTVSAPRAEVKVDVRKTVHLLSATAGNCSGVLIRPGVMLTAAHCTPYMERFSVIKNGVMYTPVNVRKDDTIDLALVMVKDANGKDLPCPCASVAKTNPKVDAPVRAVGFPMYGLINVQILTEGRMQGVDGADLVFTAPIAPGNSGGGLFNEKGELVSILSRVAAAPIGYFGVNLITHLGMGPNVTSIKEFLKR